MLNETHEYSLCFLWRRKKRAAAGSYAVDVVLSVTSFRESPNGMSYFGGKQQDLVHWSY